MKHILLNKKITDFQFNNLNTCWLEDDILVINNIKLENVYSYVLNQNNIIFSKKEENVENIYLYNILFCDRKIIFKNGGLGNRSFNNNLISISNRNSNTKDIFDLKTSKIIFKSKTPINSVLNDIVIIKDHFKLSFISLSTKECKWESNLKEYGEISKILGVSSNVLWLTLYRAGESKDKEIILGLDVNSGKLLHRLPEELPISDVHIKLIEEKQTIVSIKSGISTSFIDSYFVEIDALTGKVIRNQTIKAFEKENLKIGLWQFQEDKIYFTANKDFLNATHIGVLDYTTLDLLWFEEVKDRKAGLKEIQVSLDKIYVLDQGNQLHIYEK